MPSGSHIGIGLCCKELLPRIHSEFGRSSYEFMLRSWGHYDKDSILKGESVRLQWVPLSQQNDIIGCGVDYGSNTSFFALNGKLYGTLIK